MNKLEKSRSSNYEILCIMRNCNLEQKNDFIEKIKKTALLSDFTTKSETKTLAYPIERMDTAEYLLINFKTDHQKITEIKQVLKNPLVVRHIMINLDTEKRIKIKNSDRIKKNKKFKRTDFRSESPLRGKFSKKPLQPQQTNENQLETETKN